MSAPDLLSQILISTVVIFFFVTSLLGLALGLGLIVRSSAMVPFMLLMNQWISTRQALKPLESPLQMAPTGTTGRWFGAVLVLVGGYAALILIGTFDVHRVASVFRVDARYSLAGLTLDAVKWFLVLGSLTAIVTGIMLLFFPDAWRNVEARANRWYSTRHLEIAGDTVYLSLDRIVQAFPRAAGAVIFAMSLVAAVASGFLLFR